MQNDNAPAFHLPVIGGNQSEKKKTKAKQMDSDFRRNDDAFARSINKNVGTGRDLSLPKHNRSLLGGGDDTGMTNKTVFTRSRAAPYLRPYRICPSLWLRFTGAGTGAGQPLIGVVTTVFI